MSVWWKYLAWYLVGVAIGMASPKQQLIESLTILGPITLTALFASLLVPFAGLSTNERVQKYALQFAIVPLFGLYTVLLWHTAAIGGIALFVSAAGVHVSYWTTSYHSRQYRLEQFRVGFGQAMPATTRLIAMLNSTGHAHEADSIVRAVLAGQQPNFTDTTNPQAALAQKEAEGL